MNRYIEMLEKLRIEMYNDLMLADKNNIEHDADTLTVETVFLKLCSAQIELKIGTNEFNRLEESDLGKLMSLIINKENVYE